VRSTSSSLIRKLAYSSPLRRGFLMGSALGVGALATALFLPISRRPFVHHPPNKLLTYDEAVKAIGTLGTDSPPTVRRNCSVQLLEHGHPTKRVFVLLHGLSNCPAQFSELSRRLFERGHNVLIPRVPYHGEENRMTPEWGGLTAEEMLEAANQAVDLGRSLGREVVVAGLSISGATVAWMAQNRDDLHKAVLLAPFLAPAGVPEWALAPLERILLRLPNMFIWWDPKLRENLKGPSYVYPRFPTRIVGETMLLARAVLRESRIVPVRCPSILTVTSAYDKAASNLVTNQLLTNWRSLRDNGVASFEFASDEQVPHDFIDPNQPNQRINLVYPKIIELLEN
jgi:pimeloyl-ACP methyl ester carboxylesterase